MKNISLILCALCFSSVITAQDTQTDSPDIPRVEFGFRFMPTVSAFKMKTSGGGTVQGQATLGYGIGGLIGFNFSNHIGVQGEIIYNSLSQKYKDQEMERTIHVNYVNIPMLISFNTGKSRPVNLNFVVGPQIAYNVGSRMETSGSNGSDTMQATLVLRKGDIGFAYGAGLEFMLNERRSIRLDIGFRGVYGFLDMRQEETGTDNSRSFNVIDGNTIKTYSAYTGITFLF
ncbi:MAG TPA: porin family protein [Bacteroidia bacterium]|nr:porin family protein [Bacteroidia bacterium]